MTVPPPNPSLGDPVTLIGWAHTPNGDGDGRSVVMISTAQPNRHYTVSYANAKEVLYSIFKVSDETGLFLVGAENVEPFSTAVVTINGNQTFETVVKASPWSDSADDFLNRQISVTIWFDERTDVLERATVTRDPDCLFHNFYFGVGPDGTPNSTPTQLNVQGESQDFTAEELSSVGLNTIDDVLASGQFTAGP